MKLPSKESASRGDLIPSAYDILALNYYELQDLGMPIEVFSDEDDEWQYVYGPFRELRAHLETMTGQKGAPEDHYMIRIVNPTFSISDAPTFQTIEEMQAFASGMVFSLKRLERQS